MYLNNYSNSTVTIQLVAKRELKPYSSVKLNDKDVAIIKSMIANRAGKSKLFEDVLRMSKFRIEDSSNYKTLVADGEVIAKEDARLTREKIESASIEPLDDEEQMTMDKLKDAANIPQAPSEQVGNGLDNIQTDEDITEVGTDNLTEEEKQEIADNATEFESGEALDAAIESGDVETAIDENESGEVKTSVEDDEPVDVPEDVNAVDELEAIVNSDADDAAKFEALTAFAQDNNIKIKKAKTVASLLSQIQEELAKKG